MGTLRGKGLIYIIILFLQVATQTIFFVFLNFTMTIIITVPLLSEFNVINNIPKI